MKAITPASRYKALLTALIGLGQPFMTTAHIRPSGGGEKREHAVFYCMNIDHDGKKLIMRAYAIQSAMPATELMDPDLVVVDPEMDFSYHGDFWVGHPSKIFGDYVPSTDKSRLNLSWAAAYERKLLMTSFVINKAQCLFTFEINVSMLEAFTINEVAAEPQPNLSRGIASLGNSVGDTVLDSPRAGTTPTLGNTNPA